MGLNLSKYKMVQAIQKFGFPMADSYSTIGKQNKPPTI